jgi:hypothetical protein
MWNENFRQSGMVAVCRDPQPPPGIPRVMEMAKKSGLEFLPPPALEFRATG